MASYSGWRALPDPSIRSTHCYNKTRISDRVAKTRQISFSVGRLALNADPLACNERWHFFFLHTTLSYFEIKIKGLQGRQRWKLLRAAARPGWRLTEHLDGHGPLGGVRVFGARRARVRALVAGVLHVLDGERVARHALPHDVGQHHAVCDRQK